MFPILRVGVVFLATLCSAASAQTIYEPVRVQFGRENPYYYGGCNPRVHDLANALRNPSTTYGRVRGFRFVSDRRTVEYELPRVYSDIHGSENAHPSGYSAAHAFNDAHALQPRYFRKAEVAALPADGKGLRVVPAIPSCDIPPAGEIIIRPYVRPLRRGPVFVFPRHLLDRRLAAPSRQQA